MLKCYFRNEWGHERGQHNKQNGTMREKPGVLTLTSESRSDFLVLGGVDSLEDNVIKEVKPGNPNRYQDPHLIPCQEDTRTTGQRKTSLSQAGGSELLGAHSGVAWRCWMWREEVRAELEGTRADVGLW